MRLNWKAPGVLLSLASTLLAGGCSEPREYSNFDFVDPGFGSQVRNADLSDEEVFARGRAALAEAGLETLRWGLTPYLIPDELLAAYSPIASLVEENLGVPVEMILGENYADLEAKLTGGEVDVALISPYSYVRAKAVEDGLKVFASHVARGSPSYAAYIIVAEDSPVDRLSQLRGEPFAFVDRRSTSGWLFPAARLLEEGIHPLDDLEAQFVETHDRVFDAVVEGRVTAGALYDAALAEGRERQTDGLEVRVLAKAERAPHDAYVTRAGIPEEVADALGRTLAGISMATREGRRILGPTLGINGFIAIGNDHYDVIRRVEERVFAAGIEAAPEEEVEAPVEGEEATGEEAGEAPVGAPAEE